MGPAERVNRHLPCSRTTIEKATVSSRATRRRIAMRVLVALALALSLTIGGGMALSEAQSAMNRFLKGKATSTSPQELARAYAGSTKTVAHQPAHGPTALGHSRGGAQQKPSGPASTRRPS